MSDEIQGVLRTTAPGTCQWVFNVPEFKTLITEPEVPILWIYGPSGMGKTHLASSIVSFFKPSHLLGDNSITKAKVAAYFCPYIDFDSNGEVVSSEEVPGSSLEQKLDGVATSDSVDGSTQVIVGDEILDDPHAAEPTDIKIILQTLCWQLCEDDKEYERDLADHLESLQEKAGGNSSLNDIWSKLFVERKFFSTLQDRFVTLVIDGLDNLQTDERYQLYYLLRKVAQVGRFYR
jgi:hypothetical protein